MEVLAPENYRPKMGRTKASSRRVISLEERVARLEKIVSELTAKKPGRPKKDEVEDQA